MSERRTLLASAAFMDSAEALSILGASTAEIRTIVQRFLAACFEDLGQGPEHLDGEHMGAVLRELLPKRFAARDPLADATLEVLEAYLRFLHEDKVVTHSFEQKLALSNHGDAFVAAVQRGDQHADGTLRGKGKTIVNRGDKVGRNDPCPCGSGKKFKKCCASLGEP